MSAIGYFMDLRHAGILLLLRISGMGNRPRDGMVVLAGADQQWSTLGILRVDLGFRPRVEIGGGCLEDRHTGSAARGPLVDCMSITRFHRVCEGGPELVVSH